MHDVVIKVVGESCGCGGTLEYSGGPLEELDFAEGST